MAETHLWFFFYISGWGAGGRFCVLLKGATINKRLRTAAIDYRPHQCSKIYTNTRFINPEHTMIRLRALRGSCYIFLKITLL